MVSLAHQPPMGSVPSVSKTVSRRAKTRVVPVLTQVSCCLDLILLDLVWRYISVLVASSADKFPDLKTTFETAIANAKSNIEGDMLKLGSPSLSSSRYFPQFYCQPRSVFSSSASLAVETALVDTSTSGPEPSTSGPETNTSMKSKPNRCQVCKKRVGLTGR